jgi:hypothetical protein
MGIGMMPALFLLFLAQPSIPAYGPPPPEVNCRTYPAGPQKDACIRAYTADFEQFKRGKAKLEAEYAAREAEGERQRQALQEARQREVAQSKARDQAITEQSERVRRQDAEREAAEAARPPEEMQFVWSAKICDRMAERAESLAEIKKEHRYSKIGGVVHLGRLGELQDDVASADDDINEFRGELKAIGKRALSCRNPGVVAHRQ